jgi:hypothetical protein
MVMQKCGLGLLASAPKSSASFQRALHPASTAWGSNVAGMEMSSVFMVVLRAWLADRERS